MAHKMIALTLAGLLLTGFSWGKSDDTSDSTQSDSYSSSRNAVNSETASSSRVSAKEKNNNKAAESAPVSINAEEFPTSLLSSLATGSEEERRTRIESLKRLSQAMSKMGAEKSSGEVAVKSRYSDYQER